MWRMDVQRARYGPQVYIRDEDGYYTCFFKGCTQRYKANFSRHIEGHEKKGDEVDEEFIMRQLERYKDHPDVVNKSKFRMLKKKMQISLQSCKKILLNIKKREEAVFFLEPVDPIATGATDYYDVITDPMDLGTVEKKLSLPPPASDKEDNTSNNNTGYRNADEFITDMRKIWNNARTYNAPETIVYQYADFLSRIFEAKLESARIKAQIAATQKKLERYGLTELSLTDMLKIFDTIQREPNAWVFIEPIDPELLELPNYSQIIKKPMDFTTVYNKLTTGKYNNGYLGFANDMRLIFRNAMVYNEPNSDMYEFAEQLGAIFERELENAIDANYKRMTKEGRPCVRDPNRGRVLFWDDERQQYYFEYYDNEEPEQPPDAKKIKVEENDTKGVPAATSSSASRKINPVWSCWRPRGTQPRKPSDHRHRMDDDDDIEDSHSRRRRAPVTPQPSTTRPSRPKKASTMSTPSTPGGFSNEPTTPRSNVDEGESRQEEMELVDVETTNPTPVTPSAAVASTTAASTVVASTTATATPTTLTHVTPATGTTTAAVPEPQAPSEPPKPKLTIKLGALKQSITAPLPQHSVATTASAGTITTAPMAAAFQHTPHASTVASFQPYSPATPIQPAQSIPPTASHYHQAHPGGAL